MWGKRRGCAGEAPECARAPQEKESPRLLKSLWRALRTWFKLIYERIAQK